MVLTTKNDPALIEGLRAGQVAIIKTDTLYGLVARADDEIAVNKIYSLKGRDEGKPFIILIADVSQLYSTLKTDVSGRWPGPNSIIMPSLNAPLWLLRGGTTLAYRMPDGDDLRRLIKATGPLVAPSANPQGDLPARSIEMAQSYFGDGVDIYVDEGEVPDGTPASKLWQVNDAGDWQRLR